MDILSQLKKIAEISPSKKEPSRNQNRHDEIVKAYRNAFITKRMTAKQIKESLSIDRSNTSFRLRKLESLGYVMRDGTVSGTKTIRWTWIDGK